MCVRLCVCVGGGGLYMYVCACVRARERARECAYVWVETLSRRVYQCNAFTPTAFSIVMGGNLRVEHNAVAE